MRRRELVAFIGATAVFPLQAQTQQAGKLPIVGYLGSTTALSESQRVAAFVQRLRELGWIDGRTITIEVRWAEDVTSGSPRLLPSSFN
jgi:putative tryptophan/tyrosine transport system substrate-binding protein